MNFLSVDLQFFAGEKTEKATPRKRQEVRKKGQVAKSADVSAAFLMLIIFLLLLLFANTWTDELYRLFRNAFDKYMLMEVTEETVYALFWQIARELAFLLGPIFLAALVAAFFANFLQVGFLFTTEPLQMKLSKLDPIQGFKRMFSLRSLVELLKSILKILFVGTVTFSVLWLRLDEILTLSYKSMQAIAATLGDLTVKMGLYASVALLFLSLFDYLYQRYEFEKSIRMSKQDIKDEYKKTEGDPQVKSRIKQKQREMAMKRMMQEVPKADVVITNPTHFAIALKYDEQKADAPIVVAKGVDYVAQKIKEIANNHDVVVIENPPLARALYDQTDIGMVIPEVFFQTVAEILAYVYKLKKKI